MGGAFPRRSISASSGTGLVTGLARRELRNRAHRERSRIRFESGLPTTFRRGRVPVRRFHSTAPSIPILNHSYAAFKQMTASSGPTGLEWRVSRLRRNAVPLPRFDVSGRLRLTLTASQTFGSTYLFVRLVKNLSGPLNSVRSLAVRSFAAIRKSRLVKNLSDSHGSFFAGSLLIAYKRFGIGILFFVAADVPRRSRRPCAGPPPVVRYLPALNSVRRSGSTRSWFCGNLRDRGEEG